jgi:hypothetical protein
MIFDRKKMTPVAGTGSSAGLNELPVRAWQAVAEMSDTPSHSPRFAPQQSIRLDGSRLQLGHGIGAREPPSLTPVTFNLANPVLHPQAGVRPGYSGTTDDAK